MRSLVFLTGRSKHTVPSKRRSPGTQATTEPSPITIAAQNIVNLESLSKPIQQILLLVRAVKASRPAQDVRARRKLLPQLVRLLQVLHRGHLGELEVAAVPAVVPEGEGAVQLDEGVPVGEEDVGRQPEQVGRCGAEVWRDLDEFGGEDPGDEGLDEKRLVGRGGVYICASECPIFTEKRNSLFS